MIFSSLYGRAAENLASVPHPEQARKLVFAACRRRWENDSERLATLELDALVGELLQIYPTLEQLRTVLARIVGKLNKKDTYAEVADEVLWALGCLYGETGAVPARPVAPPTGPVDVEDFEAATQISGLGAAARILEAHTESARMRKLLYAACYNFWENDLDKLLVLDFQGLIEQARQSYPTRDQLHGRFQRVVSTLNKQKQYEQIANLILTQLDRLYSKEAEMGLLPAEELPNGPAENLAAAFGLEAGVGVPPQAAEAFPGPGRGPLEQPSQEEPATAIAPVAGEDASPEDTIQEGMQADYNAFKLRRELMRYTTPLRAKALVFSLLNERPLEPQGVDWLMLKTYNLDDLLRDLVRAHPTLKEVQENLERTARDRSQRVEDSLQAASAIALALRSVYGRPDR